MINSIKVDIAHKHMDLLKSIWRIRKMIHTTTSIYHRYSHQYINTPFANLSRKAQLNVEMDEIAQHAFLQAYESTTFIQ